MAATRYRSAISRGAFSFPAAGFRASTLHLQLAQIPVQATSHSHRFCLVCDHGSQRPTSLRRLSRVLLADPTRGAERTGRRGGTRKGGGCADLDLLDKYLHPSLMSAEERRVEEMRGVKERFRLHEGDTGSSEVQIALLTSRHCLHGPAPPNTQEGPALAARAGWHAGAAAQAAQVFEEEELGLVLPRHCGAGAARQSGSAILGA
ncbi:hypothetical protein CLOP_g17049 [Closterium sp. NIES-67]|nr:hypothetical protein CLOP_g17049 [Closterium sp. NIES-67]